ncbi:hypothetical protein H310_03783 [Aphanomyces invadans]|uniref:Uncharacterized protein n=1 Tax=Aphanomyces invadans TaxID=157072 RepID=A0A024UE60_9STRA|nr:hypothetical protein H310_03783 [Aphanomyces invadans]ETW04559.1 hypothetical protein H310_03783 [Aphanomyces invadans]|eukprot:XP_008865997.1 hypothetical protein H310_03783 [Aphanomyces invadans]
MSSFVIFCAAVVVAAMCLASSVGGTDVSVVGVAGVFTAPDGPSCGGTSRIGVCPGPQPRLEFGSCCQALPNRPSLVLGCVPLRSETAACGVSPPRPAATTAATPPTTTRIASAPERTSPPSSTPERTRPKPTASTVAVPVATYDMNKPTESSPRQTASLRKSTATPTTTSARASKTMSAWMWLAVGLSVVVAVVGCVVGMQRWRHRRQVQARRLQLAGLEQSNSSLSPTTPQQPWGEVPTSGRNRPLVGEALLDHWVAIWLRTARAPAAPNSKWPWTSCGTAASLAMSPTPPAVSTGAAPPRAWYLQPVCADCGIEESNSVSLLRTEKGLDLRCAACSSLWV